MSYTKQQHVFQTLNLCAGSDDITKTVNAFIVFPVKEVRFNFAYTISSTHPNIVLYTITSDLVNNDIVGTMTNFILTDNIPDDWYSDGIKKQNEFSYIFRDPIQVQGGINFRFLNQTATNPTSIQSNVVVVHLEFLGE